jgi:hypothetical protein
VRYREFFENVPKQEIFIRAFRSDISCKPLLVLETILQQMAVPRARIKKWPFWAFFDSRD